MNVDQAIRSGKFRENTYCKVCACEQFSSKYYLPQYCKLCDHKITEHEFRTDSVLAQEKNDD